MSAIYGHAEISAQQQWSALEGIATKSEGVLRLASLQQIGSSLVETLSALLNTPFNALAARQGTADISSRVEATLSQLVSQRVAISSLAKVRNYLLQNSDLLDLLPTLCKTIAERFDPGTKQRLEYYQDPQYEDDEYLSLYLRLDPVDLSMIETIDSITDAYSEAFANIKGWILIAPDFQRGD
jgi:hypothetical protein